MDRTTRDAIQLRIIGHTPPIEKPHPFWVRLLHLNAAVRLMMTYFLSMGAIAAFNHYQRPMALHDWSLLPQAHYELVGAMLAIFVVWTLVARAHRATTTRYI